MAREWVDLPKAIEYHTKFGPVLVNIVAGDKLYIDANSNGKFVTVRGNEYSYSVHLTRQPNGDWTFNPSYVYTSKRGDFSINGKMPPTYLAKVTAEMIEIAKSLWATRKDLFREAHEADCNNEAHRIESDMDKLAKELQELQVKLTAVDKKRLGFDIVPAL